MRINTQPFKLGKILGIPILVHYSWLPVFPFYAWAIAAVLLPRQAPGLPIFARWALGLLTTGLLFGSVLGHELAHSLMAKAEGLGTGKIMLYIFGGLSSLEGQPALPSSEFKIAVVGPAASFAIGTLFFAGDQALSGTAYRSVGQVLGHLGLVNWFLAGFNILPGLPLDGGRVLRAALWHFNKNFGAATRIAVRAGFLIALALVAWGGVGSILFYGDYITGSWSIIVGLVMVVMLRTSEGRDWGSRRIKRGTVEEVMNPNVVLVPPGMSVADFINKVLQNNRDTSFPIAQDRRLHGMLVLEEMKSIPQEQWPHLQTRQVMRPVDSSMFLNATAPVTEARRFLAVNGHGRAIVLDSNGLIIGFVTAQDLARNVGRETKE